MNAQQPQADYYPGYGGAPLSHSPNSARPGYATTVGVPTTLGASGRRNQQGVDSVSQSTAALFADDRFASSFDAPSQRFDRGTATPSSLQNAFSMFNPPNQAAWAYNGASSAATMNGPIGDGSRIRSSSRRPPLHSEWTAANNEASLTSQAASSLSYYTPAQQHMVGQTMGLSHSGSPDPYSMVVPPTVNIQNFGQPEMRSFPEKKDMGDLIPTAIVIKNIPFNVRKEYLTSVMIDLHLPQPYAFNYHFDNGIFRGLAFANFQNAQDTALVIDRMNGLDIQGRKLRVEYKKMLPEHERERIEREKREKRGQLEEQHRGPAHQVSISSIATTTSVQRPAANDRSTGRVDLNDPRTLQFYLDLYVFHNDEHREVHIFPADTTPEDRRLIHILAHNMGLEHTSIGEGENRQVHVSKSKFTTAARQASVQQPGVPLDGHPRGLSRAATYDFNDRQQHPSVHSINRNPTLAVPNSPETHQHGGMNGLRGVKSFADLRSFSPSPSPSMVSSGALAAPQTNGHNGSTGFLPHYPGDSPFGPSLTTPTTPGAGLNPPPPTSSAPDASLVNGLGSLSLGSSYDGNGNIPGRPRETPGAIGSQRPSANGNNSNNRAIPERQPRGPVSDWENPSGFSRSRANGHMQRGSDSSDNTGRLGAAHGSAALY